MEGSTGARPRTLTCNTYEAGGWESTGARPRIPAPGGESTGARPRIPPSLRRTKGAHTAQNTARQRRGARRWCCCRRAAAGAAHGPPLRPEAGRARRQDRTTRRRQLGRRTAFGGERLDAFCPWRPGARRGHPAGSTERRRCQPSPGRKPRKKETGTTENEQGTFER